MEKTNEHSRENALGLFKVVLIGPESTGKTTLAQELAAHYNTVWVPEFMREYLMNKWESKKELIDKSDLIPIAKGQMALEDKLKKKANEILIYDTNLTEIKVYSQHYYNGFVPDLITIEATKRKYDIYLLTYIDVPWEEDILRDRPHQREEMFALFEEELKEQKLNYRILKGNREKRFIEAVSLIDNAKSKIENEYSKYNTRK